MSRKTRRFFAWSAFVALVIIGGMASATYLSWPPLEPLRSYVAQEGDTWENIALRFSVSVKELVRVNQPSGATSPIREGQSLVIPPPSPPSSEVWQAHGFGILAEALGVIISLWLAKAAGLLPRRLRKSIAGLSLAIALISYASTQAAAPEPLSYVSPQFIFASIKDGFTWSASMPMIARAFGVLGKKR